MLQVAVVFTIACVILSGNAVLSFWPNVCPGFTPPPAILYIEGVLSVMSSALFLIGGIVSFIEIIKTRRGERLTGALMRNYGTAIVEDDVADEEEKILEKKRSDSVRIAVTEVLERTTSLARTISLPAQEETLAPTGTPLTWRNLPTLRKLRTHYLASIPFTASLVSLVSSFVYTLTGVLALISIIRTHNIATWIRYPQLAAAVGFATSSYLAMLQSQTVWYLPALRKMVWHANLLNLIGSLGFVFCSVLGLLQHSWAEWGFGCTFLWGSWAFLIASGMSSFHAWRRGRKVERGEVSKV